MYITRAKGLAPRDSNGKSDPYLVVKLGSKKISTKERYIANELNPFFGEMFEFSCQIPIAKDLKVKSVLVYFIFISYVLYSSKLMK